MAASPMGVDLLGDGALLERLAADLRAVARVALRGHAAGHAGGDEGRAAGHGVDLLGPSAEPHPPLQSRTGVKNARLLSSASGS